ncbi:hypothetical protein TSAR_013355 [Trichomalopsis sarcophagae]|uniref:Cadherin domain-containing protein n=1 Tax=Trichomalopsis sarcophagae TaxID=543379 RepID=A0A232FCS6_9HYME|nr:hypothetical protein TSAR_013355 [Trichomalopsis sarcophagae]
MKVLNSALLAVYLLVSLFCEGISGNKPSCKIYHENSEKLFSEDEWNRGLELGKLNDDTAVGILKTYKTANISKILTYKVSGHDNYLTVTKPTEKDEFYIEIRDNFDQYEEKETAETMSLEIKFACDDNESRILKIKIPLRDTNNHSPQFLKSKYEYKLAMPLPKGFDFDTIDQIAVRDVDLTNKAIDFAIKGDEKYTKGFLITSLGRTKEDKKNFTARFITSMIIDFEEDTTFTLSATDAGKPTRTTETNLTIVVDKANSFPRFAEPEYVADLKNLDYGKVKKIMLNFSNGNDITLDRGFEGPVNFSLSGLSEENKKHFKLSSKGSKVQIELSDLSDTFLSQGVISAALTATKETTETSTAIIVLLPEVPVSKATETSTTVKPQESKTKDDSVNGYMVSTIILSLTTVGLLGYVIYLHFYRT